MTTRRLFLVLSALALGTTARAQVTLYTATFEGDTTSSPPAGWVNGSGNMQVISNPNTGGINPSAQVLSWTSEGTYETSQSIDLSSYASGYTFAISFDLYNPTTTTAHSLIIGYGLNGMSSDAWYIGDQVNNAGQTYNAVLSATATWQTFNFDFTPAVNNYLSLHPSSAASFSLFLQEWSAGGGQISQLDNLTVTATAIPEPSTYAALAGAAALGLTALRRRRAAA